jgi:hypothetical protein
VMRIVAVSMGVTLACLCGDTAVAAQSKDVELRAVLDERCVVADEPYYIPSAEGVPRDKALGLVGIIVGKIAGALVEHAIKVAVEKWRERGQDAWYTTLPATELYVAQLDPAPALELNPAMGCLTVVAGAFEPPSTDCAGQYVPKSITPEILQLPESQWHTSRTLDSAQNQLRRANICTDGEPRAVMEARIELSNDGTAYRLSNAGYRINSLLGTQDAKAERFVFYTVEIREPGAVDESGRLSTAWLNLGGVSAGKLGAETPATSDTPWQKVPPLSAEARRIYDERTRAQIDTHAQIEELERAIVRHQRIIVNLEERVASASRDLVPGLREQIRANRVQIQASEAELAARKAEYAELPHEPVKLMPVSIRVGVTEARSEKRAQAALAKFTAAGSASIATRSVP